MFNVPRILTFTAIFTTLCFSGSAALAEEQANPTDLGTFLCRDVMILSGEDREIALALVHGYRLGKMNTTKYVIHELAEITDKFMDYCLDNPAANALEAFEKVAKKP